MNYFVVLILFLFHLIETSLLQCSIAIEYETNEFKDNLQCNIRFHGSHCLSPVFPLHITSDKRMQMNFEYNDVGEVVDVFFFLLLSI